MRWTCAFIILPALLAGEERFAVDSQGRLAVLLDAGDELPARSVLVTPVGREESLRAEVSQEGRRVKVRVTRSGEWGTSGTAVRLEFPRDQFAGGMTWIEAQQVQLGTQRPPGENLTAGTSKQFGFRDADGAKTLTAELSEPRPVALLDEWHARAGRIYVARIDLEQGPVELFLDLVAKPESRAARLTVDASARRYKLHGFGGNYCFQIESPVTQYTLEHLKSAWARTEMTLAEWEPENDNAAADEINWEYFRAQDNPGSNLRREFELMKQIQDKGLPYAVSIWWLPEWMYTDPHLQQRSAHRRKVAPPMWAEMLESIGSYLLHAKQQYGAEPDLFSFNEANIGVYVQFTPEEHREAIKSIGAHLRKLGLKTKILLADATGPSGTHVYSLPSANDVEALQYVGAVSFHSWGGATPAQYASWGDVAEWLGLPLLVGEVGVDAAAWRNRMYDTYHYGLREVKMYQELLLHARPQGLLRWEYTADYSLVRVKKEQGGERLEPTARFYFLKQFSNLTPRHSHALATASDHDRVLVTAFDEDAGGFAAHIANLGAAREAEIEGLPLGLASMRAVITTEDEHYRALEDIRIENGRAAVRLPARSLLTLTTMPEESR